MRQRLVIGNWKMHGNLAANLGLLHALRQGASIVGARGVSTAVCVPYPYLYQARSVLSGTGISWGAQDVSEYRQGAYTGEVSAPMLADFDCRYVLVGHSERRALFGDTDDVVADKAVAALKARLVPVVCVGETLAEREAGITREVVLRQLEAVIAKCGVGKLASCVVAYEPVWAIGTGRTATPEQAQEIHALIRERVASHCVQSARSLKILYGGSVKPNSAAGLFAQPDIDGGLIGGASLVAADFLTICAA